MACIGEKRQRLISFRFVDEDTPPLRAKWTLRKCDLQNRHHRKMRLSGMR